MGDPAAAGPGYVPWAWRTGKRRRRHGSRWWCSSYSPSAVHVRARVESTYAERASWPTRLAPARAGNSNAVGRLSRREPFFIRAVLAAKVRGDRPLPTSPLPWPSRLNLLHDRQPWSGLGYTTPDMRCTCPDWQYSSRLTTGVPGWVRLGIARALCDAQGKGRRGVTTAA